MNTSGNTKSKRLDPRNIFGVIPGSFDEAYFERETSTISQVTQTAGGVFEAIFSLGKDITGSETNGAEKFPSKGTIEFNKAAAEQSQKQKADTERRKAFFQALKEDMDRAQKAKDRLLFEEELNGIATNLPTEQKNRLLHYQLSYKDRSIYQRAELRKKLIEEQKKGEKQQKEASIPSPAKQPNALEAAFEGGAGSQGKGTANLSALAVG
ncbi:hypothetical protein KKE03_02480 [Patescibacteria group bacterium]|nr:hypothetical protein [Patescibacteria group bacterium]